MDKAMTSPQGAEQVRLHRHLDAMVDMLGLLQLSGARDTITYTRQLARIQTLAREYFSTSPSTEPIVGLTYDRANRLVAVHPNLVELRPHLRYSL